MAVACNGGRGEGWNFGGRLAFRIEMAVMVEGERVDELGVDAAVSQSVVSLACYSGIVARCRIRVISFGAGGRIFPWSLSRQRWPGLSDDHRSMQRKVVERGAVGRRQLLQSLEIRVLLCGWIWGVGSVGICPVPANCGGVAVRHGGPLLVSGRAPEQLVRPHGSRPPVGAHLLMGGGGLSAATRTVVNPVSKQDQKTRIVGEG